MKNNRLIRLRTDIAFTQAEAARAIGIHVDVLVAYEAGAFTGWHPATGWSESAVMIADFHGVSPEEIWSDGAQDRRHAEGEAARGWMQPVRPESPVDRREERIRVGGPVPKLLRKTATSQAN